MALLKLHGPEFSLQRYQSNLSTVLLGRCLHWYPELSSTMDIAWAAAKLNAPTGTIVLTETQSNGRGRAGRTWKGDNHGALLFSLLIKAPSDFRQAVQVNLGIAVAVVAAIKHLNILTNTDEIGVKWPNDVWVNGKKLCGILVDNDSSYMNVGVGINVNNQLDESVKAFATNLGGNIDREVLLSEIMNQFESLLEQDLKDVLDSFSKFDLLRGKQIVVMPKRMEDVSSHYVADCVGLSTDGFLLVKHAATGEEQVLSGEEVSVRPFLESMESKSQ